MNIAKTKGFELGEKYFKIRMVLPAIIVMCILAVIPVMIIVWLSVHSWYISSFSVPEFVGLRNFVELFQDELFINAIKLTVIYTFVSLAFEVVLGVGFASALNSDFKGKSLLRTLLLIPMLATPVAVAFIWKNVFDPTIGLLNYILELFNAGPYAWVYHSNTVMQSLILVDIWKWTPMITIIVLAGYAALPKEPYESSIVDGANIFQRFWYITLPLLRPTIIVAAMFRLIDLMKTFDLVYVISGGGPGNSSELLYLYIYQQTFNFYHMGYGSAAVLILFLSILTGIVLLGLVRRSKETT